MNVFAFVSLIAVMFCLALGLLVLYLNHKPALNRIFFLTALIGFVYTFTTVMMWIAPTAENAFIWHKLGTIWPFFSATVFTFALIFTNNKWIKNKIHYIVIYLPAIAFFLIDAMTEYINTAPVLQVWGYNDLAAETWLYAVSTFWSALLPLLAFGLCFRYYLKAKDVTQKQRGKFVSIGIAIPILAFIVTNMVARGLGMGIPNLGPIATLFFAIFVGYAIVKYDLFTIDAALAAENIVSTIPDALILANMNSGMLKVNQRLVDFSGFSEAELIGQPITKLCRDNPRECTAVIEELTRDSLVRNRELVLQTKTGEKRHVLFTGSVVTSKSGHPLGLTCVIHDITERKIAEEELANTKNYLETLLNSMLSGIIVIDGKTHEIVDANISALKMIGATREEVIGKVCHNFVCPGEKATCPITDLGSEIANDERVLLTSKGERKQILKSVVKLQLKDRLLLIENFIDLSQRKIIEEKLIKAQRLASIGELAGQLGHDLRNPLAGIKNGVYLVKKKGNKITEEDRAEILRIIEVAIEDSNRIVTSLIEYSSELLLTPELCTPKSLVADALSKIQVPSHINLQNEASDETKMLLDTTRLESVFAGIIQNAMQAMPEKGALHLKSCVDGSNMQFCFEDTGVGIAEDMLDRIFTPLVTTKAKGMGMSLAICKRVVEAHGGKVSVESHVGLGTKIKISLPIKQSRMEFAAAQAALSTSPFSGFH